MVLVPVSACAPARALSCTSSACVPACHSADLLTPVRCVDSSTGICACMRACNTNTSRHARGTCRSGRQNGNPSTVKCTYALLVFVCVAETKKIHKNQNFKYSSAAVDKRCLQILSCSLSQSLSANFVMQRFACRVHKVCLQRYNLCHAEVVQRLHRGWVEAVQRLCRGCTVAVQRLHSGCTVAVQRLCRCCAEVVQMLCRGCADSVQRLRRGCAEAAQRLCRGCAGAVQGLCRGCAGAAQWLYRGCTEDVQRLHRDYTEATQRLCTGCAGAVQWLCRSCAGAV